MLRVQIVSDSSSWLNEYIPAMVEKARKIGGPDIIVWSIDEVDAMERSDLSFFLSCFQVVPAGKLSLSKHNLVVHESDLPRGRGWSPLTWQILEGQNRIVVSLIEATEPVDSGDIYLQQTIEFDGTELVRDLRAKQAEATELLFLSFITEYPSIVGRRKRQSGEPTYYRRRRRIDSCLDPELSISEQFNLLRVVDNDRYPAYFEYRGTEYILRIEKSSH